LRSQNDFDLVYKQDFFAADDVLVIRARRNGLGFSRVGLSVSRRVGNAVVRNRWKRLIREAFRQQKGQIPVGIDLVVRPRKGAMPEHGKIFKSIVSLANRLDKKLPKQTND
jgi:ribonuclease P protein component